MADDGARALIALAKGAQGSEENAVVYLEEQALPQDIGSEVPTSTERPGYCVFKVPAKELMVWAKGFGVYFAITAASGALQKDPVAVLTMAPVTGILVTVIHSAGRYIRGR